jgi:hypothetical protein
MRLQLHIAVRLRPVNTPVAVPVVITVKFSAVRRIKRLHRQDILGNQHHLSILFNADDPPLDRFAEIRSEQDMVPQRREHVSAGLPCHASLVKIHDGADRHDRDHLNELKRPLASVCTSVLHFSSPPDLKILTSWWHLIPR